MLRAAASIPNFVGTFTWATLPAAASYTGLTARVSDYGAPYLQVISDGTRWVPFPIQILTRSGIPMILPSSGTSNASGQITLTTALPYQPAAAFIYLPVGVITAGSQGTAAGLYAVTFSSTTVCQVTGTGIVSANTGYTQTTASDLTLATVTVPANSMGINGRVMPTSLWTFPNNANTKTMRVKFGGTTFQSFALTTVSTQRAQCEIVNRGVANIQISANTNNGGYTSGTTATVNGAIDTTADATLLFTGNLSVATDYIILESARTDIAG